MNSSKITPQRLTLSIVCSLAAGFCAASLYVTFRHGFNGEAMLTFSVFAFWYETPFYVGYVTSVFYYGLAIIVLTSGVVLLSQLIISLRNREHHGTARWGNLAKCDTPVICSVSAASRGRSLARRVAPLVRQLSDQW